MELWLLFCTEEAPSAGTTLLAKLQLSGKAASNHVCNLQ
jgi:hypothetical protein